MKLHFILLIIALAFSSLHVNATEKQTVVTIVGDDSYPPYSFNNNGKPDGIYTDIVQTAVQKMGDYLVLIETKPWKRGLKMLENGETTFLYPPYKRQKSRPYMAYSVPILEEKLTLFCLKDLMTSPRPNFPEDYKGLSIGENLGFSSGDKVNQAKKNGIIRLSSIKGTRSNLKKLILKRLDCYINDRLSILVELKNLHQKNMYDGNSVKEATTLSVEHGYLGIATRNTPAYTKAFVEQFNAAIMAMKKDGTIDKIIHKHTQK